jgi:hypothetical protein
MRVITLIVTFVIASLVTTFSTVARAESVEELAKKLLGADDFRVRTQAALALGASGEKKAVTPLCKGLDDGNDAVRAAAAAGLGKLAQGGQDCLKKRLAKESSGNVKKMIEKSLRLLDDAASGPVLGDATKYYLAIGPVENATARKNDELASVVRKALMRAAQKSGGFAFAPPGESAADAKKRLRKHPHVVGYFAKPRVQSTKTGQQIAVTCNLDLFGYPEKDSLGNVGRSAGVGGVDTNDTAEEDRLIDKTCGEAMSEFAKMAAQVD